MNATKWNLQYLKAEVVKAGHKLSAGSWEDEFMAYASSKDVIPGTFGHPRFEATICKRTGWVRIGKQAPFKMDDWQDCQQCGNQVDELMTRCPDCQNEL
jgi:hypothetical protein